MFRYFRSLKLFLFFNTLVFASFAQTTDVTLKVFNLKKERVPFVNAIIYPLNDSFNLIQKIADSTGTITLMLQINKQYHISITSANYIAFEKGVTIKNTHQFINIILINNTKILKGVKVTIARPVLRQDEDKTIVDPENLALSSTNAYEILEKTPGLFIDQDGNVYLNSTTPAKIYINGREQKMNTADIATLLKNLPPNSIASIEIIRTPSAKYDASGSGGIVNVILKKGIRIGLTGSVNIGGNKGKYENSFVGLNLNNYNGKMNTYLNLQYSKRNNFDETKTDRIFAMDSLISQDAFTVFPTNSYFMGSGISYILNKKWDLNTDTRITLSDFTNISTNNSIISEIASNKVITNNYTNVLNKGNSFNLSQGLNAKYKIDSVGSEWTTDLSYNYSPNNSNQNFNTRFYVPAIGNRSGDGSIKTNLNILSAESNLLWKLEKKISIETGLKTTIVGFKNKTEYFNQSNFGPVKDIGRSSVYSYKEYITAVYLQASKSIIGITLKAGTRIENTNMAGNQVTPIDTSFSVHRTDLFPYVFISRPIMKIFSYELKAYLVFRRSISRPGYQLLNPSKKFIDQYLFETGNPSLKPQFTQNGEANISVNERPIIAIGINDTKDVFTNVVYQSDSNKSVAFRTYDNLGTNKEIYYRALGGVPPGHRYFIVAGFQYNHNFYNGYYENKPLYFQKGSWSIFTYQTLKLTNNTQLILHGFARFNGQLQFYELSSFGSVNLSINQQLMKRKITLSASINDIFLTNNNDFVLKQGSVYATGFRKGDTRRLGLNFRYNFGIKKKEENVLLNIDSPEKTN